MRVRDWERAAVVLIVVVWFAPAAWAGPRDPQLTFENDRGGGDLVLTLRNPLPFPITATVRVRTARNLRPPANFPMTVVVGGYQQETLAHLTPLSPNQSSSLDSSFTYQPGRAGAKHDDRVMYTLPFQAGCAYPLTQGYNGHFTHQGQCALDFAMPEGTPVCAARDGRVVNVMQNFSQGGISPDLLPKANEFCVLHDDGTIARYAHLRKDGINLRVGDYVRAGYPLGFSGNTGFSSGPHLHFDVIRIIDGEHSETVPVRFATADGPAMALEEGHTYMRPYRDQALGEQRAPKNAAELAQANTAAVRRLVPNSWNVPAAVAVGMVGFRVLRRMLKSE